MPMALAFRKILDGTTTPVSLDICVMAPVSSYGYLTVLRFLNMYM